MYKTVVYTLAIVAVSFADRAVPQDDRSTAAAQQAAERMLAEERRMKGAETKFIQEHVAAVKAERKDESWARKQEGMLRKAAADADAALGQSLKGVDCRRTRCAIDIELDASASGEEHARRLSSIDEWIAGSQPCGYTIVHDPAVDARSVRVFTDCAEQRRQ